MKIQFKIFGMAVGLRRSSSCEGREELQSVHVKSPAVESGRVLSLYERIFQEDMEHVDLLLWLRQQQNKQHNRFRSLESGFQ